MIFFFKINNKKNTIEHKINNELKNNSTLNNSSKIDVILTNKSEIQIDESNINTTKNTQNFKSLKTTEEKTQNMQNKDYRQIALENGLSYMKLCKEGQLINDKSKFIKSSNPKISVVMPMYNCEDTLKAAVRSVQNQKMLEIEIIIVNDNSGNKTVNSIKELYNEDPRISIINNNKTMSTFYSRSVGILSANGKYSMHLDCDDIFLAEDLFDIIYDAAEEGNYDIISFKSFDSKNPADKNGYKDVFTNNKKDNLIILQPELGCYCVSNNGEEAVNDLYIWGKLFRTEVYKQALNKLGYERYSTRMIWNEDYSQLFVLYNCAKSYKFISKYGHYFHSSPKSNSNKESKNEKTYGDIFFDNIIFDFGKGKCKSIAAQRLISLKKYNTYSLGSDKAKDLLKNLISKIIDSEYIEDKYKAKIKEIYSEFYKPKNSTSFAKI